MILQNYLMRRRVFMTVLKVQPDYGQVFITQIPMSGGAGASSRQ